MNRVCWTIELTSFVSLIVLFMRGALFKRDLSSKKNRLLYRLLKLNILIVCFFPLCCHFVYLIPFVLLYAYTFMQDVELYFGRPDQTFRHFGIWKKIAEAKNSSIVRTTELPPGQYMFAAHPHGVLPLGICLNVGTNGTNLEGLFPGIAFRGVAVSACYVIPFYRDLCLSVGGTDCRASTIHALLDNGISPVVVPGGAEESILTVNHHNHILMRHKGFIRIAIMHGVPIVPMYSFGENNWWDIPEGAKPIAWLNSLTKKFLGFCIPPARSLAPHNTKITTVFGKPIAVNKQEKPTEEEVNRLFNEYVEQIKELFAKYRHEDDCDLVIEY